MSAHPSVVPFQFFATADGYIAIACPKEKFFRALAVAIELPGLQDDPRFLSFTARAEHRAELLELLEARFRLRTTETWIQQLGGQVPCAPVRSLSEALEPDGLTARRLLASYPHPVFGTVHTVGTPLTVGDFEPSYRMAPLLGADNEEILHELGYDDARIHSLCREGAFGTVTDAS
jgi:crotonobetainyl-CoA:carnitine CoA-transferase CaiB-like acyl-CoA transferase